MYIYTYIHVYIYVCIYICIYLLPFGSWDLNCINYFRLTILVRRKSTSQTCWVIKPVPHNLVRRIRSWSIIFSGTDFVYLYWKTSKIILKSGSQLVNTNHGLGRADFIEFIVAEMKQFVSSNPNVILKRQTCGQRSSMAAWIKLRALAFHFSIRFCSMFPISKFRREFDLGLCKTWVPAGKMPLRIGEFRLENVFGCKISPDSPMRSGILFASTQVFAHI